MLYEKQHAVNIQYSNKIKLDRYNSKQGIQYINKTSPTMQYVTLAIKRTFILYSHYTSI